MIGSLRRARADVAKQQLEQKLAQQKELDRLAAQTSTPVEDAPQQMKTARRTRWSK